MPGSVNLTGRAGCTVHYGMKLTPSSASTTSSWTRRRTAELARDRGVDGHDERRLVPFEDDLSAFDGQPNVFLRFGLDVDDSVTRDGAHIDNIDLHCVGTTYNADSFEAIQGTSMASPHVAGVAALALAKNPSTTVAQLKTAILNGGDAIGSLSGKTVTGRRLNAAGTLALIRPPRRTPERRTRRSRSLSPPRSTLTCQSAPQTNDPPLTPQHNRPRAPSPHSRPAKPPAQRRAHRRYHPRTHR